MYYTHAFVFTSNHSLRLETQHPLEMAILADLFLKSNWPTSATACSGCVRLFPAVYNLEVSGVMEVTGVIMLVTNNEYRQRCSRADWSLNSSQTSFTVARMRQLIGMS